VEFAGKRLIIVELSSQAKLGKKRILLIKVFLLTAQQYNSIQSELC
jgi:hypothetical protein